MNQGSSSGSSDDDRFSRLQVKAYVKTDARIIRENGSACVPVMVSIKAAPRGTAEQRAAIDVVLVLHVNARGMAPENWHDLLSQETKLVVDELGDDDRLAVVPVKPTLLPMSPENKAAASDAVVSSPEGMTRYTPLLSLLESADSILYGRGSDEKETRVGHIVVVSNSYEDTSSLLTRRFLSIHGFGSRDSHNGFTVMYSIPSCSRESSCAISDDGDLISAVEPVEFKLTCKEEVVLSAIYAPRISHFISYDKKTGIVWANVPHAGAATNVVAYLDIPAGRYHRHEHECLTVKVKHGGPQVEVVTVTKGTSESKEAASEMVRIEAMKKVASIAAQGKADCEQLQATADALREWWGALQKESDNGREAGGGELISRLAAEMQEMETRLHNDYSWREYMLSWQAHQWWPLPPPPPYVHRPAAAADAPLLHLRIIAKDVVDAFQLDPAAIQKPQQGIPVEILVMVPVEGLAREKRAPLDLVAVLDVSRRGVDKTKRLLTQAMELIMEKLSRKDRLAIIHAQSAADEPAVRLLPMTKEWRSEYTKVLSVVTSDNTTAQQRAEQPLQPGRRSLLIATGNSSATAVRGTTTLSKSLMDAVKLLDDRPGQPAEEKHRMGFIVVISDNDDISVIESSIGHGTLRSDYTVRAFSFRGGSDAKDMYLVGSSSGGMYGIADDPADTTKAGAFLACISQITSIVATNTKVNVMCNGSSSMTLSAIEAGKFKSSIKDVGKSGSILAGALYAGEARTFVAYVDNISEDYISLPKMLVINVMWHSTSSTVEKRLEGPVLFARSFKSAQNISQAAADFITKVRRRMLRSLPHPSDTDSMDSDTDTDKII